MCMYVDFWNLMSRFLGDLVSFGPVTTYNLYFELMLGFVAFIVTFRFLHILRYNKSVALMLSTLGLAANECLSFSLAAAVPFLAYTLAMAQLFARVDGYSSIYDAINSNVAAMMGKFKFVGVVELEGTFGSIFLIMYLLSMMVLVMNIFITLLNKYLDVVKQNKNVWVEDTKVVDHIFDMLKSMIFPAELKQGEDKGTCRFILLFII